MSQWVECSSMVREIRVQSQVESYQKLFKKWHLIPPCLTLSFIRYVWRVKWSNQGKGVVPSPSPRVVAIENGAFGSPSITVANFTTLLIYVYIYIYIYICGFFNKFPDFFVQAFRIVVESWKFSTLLMRWLTNFIMRWLTNFMISGSNEQLQQQLEYTLLKHDCHSWWISKMQSGL